MTEDNPFRREGLGYRFSPNGPARGVILAADHLHRKGDDVTCEIVVEFHRSDHDVNLLAQTRHNLVSMRAHSELAKYLSSQQDGVAWNSLLLSFCASILAAERRGEPFETVGDDDDWATQTYLIDPLLAAGECNLIYAPGDSGKSRLAAFLALIAHLGLNGTCEMESKAARALYLDWESQRRTLNGQLRAFTTGLALPPAKLFYRSCRRDLASQVEEVARFISHEGIEFVIIDSVEMASGSGGDHDTYQDRALRMLEAIRALGPITTLLVDHVSKETQRALKPGQALPYGSVFKLNEVRWAWEMRKSQALGDPVMHVGLYNTKHNNAAQHGPVGLAFEFRPDGAIVVERKDDAAVQAMNRGGTRLAAWERIEDALGDGNLLVEEIARKTGLKPENVRKELNRHPDKFVNTSLGLGGAGHTGMWARRNA